MEKIEIKDMVTLRAYALSFVKNFVSFGGVKPDDSLDAAKQFEAYIKGDAELPEYNSPMDSAKMWSDMLDKISPKNSMWISADDGLKPAKGIDVLCALKYGSTIEYDTLYYDPETKEWYGGRDEDNGNHVVAWMGFPAYNPSV